MQSIFPLIDIGSAMMSSQSIDMFLLKLIKIIHATRQRKRKNSNNPAVRRFFVEGLIRKSFTV